MLWLARVRALATILSLLTTAASAQQELSGQSYWDRCYGGTQGQPGYVVFGSYPTGHPPPSPVSGGMGGSPAGSFTGGGAGGGEALLVVAVVAAAALPIIVYALDADPPPQVLRRFYCPSVAFDGWGGAESGHPTAPWAGIAAARIRFAVSHFGTDVQFDVIFVGVGSFSVYVLLRPTPKEHLEGGLALGYKRSYLGSSMREGFEVGLPQLYTLWRLQGRQLQLELRPGVFITTQKTVDVSVDTAVLIPVLEFLSVRLGSRAFSYDGQPMLGVSGGLSLHL